MIAVAAIAAELGLHDPVITPLCGGLSNRSWRLRDAAQDLVLRESGAGSELLGADRRSEIAMQRIAAGAGLAPPVVLARPGEGLLVTRHIDGPVLSYDAVREPAMLGRIGTWCAALHALAPPPGLAVIDLGARAEGYLQSLGSGMPGTLLRQLERNLAKKRNAMPQPERLAPCHHDLHHLNLVDRGNALTALDWEYAGPGDAAADLAACICYHDLDAQQVAFLLGGYGDASQPLLTRVAPLRWIFDCLWLGWLEIAASQGVAVDAGRRQCLIDRLSS